MAVSEADNKNGDTLLLAVSTCIQYEWLVLVLYEAIGEARQWRHMSFNVNSRN